MGEDHDIGSEETAVDEEEVHVVFHYLGDLLKLMQCLTGLMNTQRTVSLPKLYVKQKKHCGQ